jgi:F-type H+-transporting ATPase subunit delta
VASEGFPFLPYWPLATGHWQLTMANQTHSSPTAVAYAQSLLELATEQGQAEQVGQELRGIRQLIDENPVFGEFLRDPGIAESERSAMLEKLFQGRTSPLLWNFLRVLNNKGRLGLLRTLDDTYDELLAERQGRVEVDVIVAQRLTDEQLEEVRRRVGEALGKQAVVHQYVDESIIGGLILRVQDRLIDASVRQQLRAMREQLLAARPKAARLSGDVIARAGGNGEALGGDAAGGARAY